MREFPQVSLVGAADSGELAAALPGAEILIVNNRGYDASNAKIIRDSGDALRWIQFCTSGIDNGVKQRAAVRASSSPTWRACAPSRSPSRRWR